jgi:guanylate kinase
MNTDKRVVVIAGPAGSGKDSIARELVKRFSDVTLMVTATTRGMRPNEKNRVNYHFLTNEQFKKELDAGNIPEHYHRAETDTYYGTYEPDIEEKLNTGKIVLAVVQIVGAKYLKEKYNATTVFIMPPSLDAFEKRVRARSPMSDIEWQERLKFTQSEVASEAPWYDYRISNEDGKLESAVSEVVGILRKEGYNLE